MQTSLWGIARKAKENKKYRFGNLYGLIDKVALYGVYYQFPVYGRGLNLSGYYTSSDVNAGLGSLGLPVKLLLDDQPLFVCCQGCVVKVREKPLLYLPRGVVPRASAVPPPPRVPISVTEATADEAAEIRRQRECPVQYTPLGERGPPLRVTFSGQSFFVCCRDCAAQVQQNPEEYLTRVAQLRAGR